MMAAVVGALLGLLKLAGILLAVVLALVLLLLICILFVPIRYRLEGSHRPSGDDTAGYRAGAGVSWLLHLLSVSIEYGMDGLSYQLRVFGIDILKLIRRLRERRERRREKSRQASIESSEKMQEAEAEPLEHKQAGEDRYPEKKQVSQAPKENRESEASFEKSKMPRRKKKKTKQKRESIGVRWKRFKEGLSQKWEQQKARLRKASSDVKSIRAELGRESNRRAIGALWREICYLLGRYKPRHLRVDVRYSLGDPALTGELLGGVSLLPVLYRHPCTILPDFQTEHMYADGVIEVKGKVTVCHLLFSALRLLWNKDVKQLYRRISKRS